MTLNGKYNPEQRKLMYQYHKLQVHQERIRKRWLELDIQKSMIMAEVQKLYTPKYTRKKIEKTKIVGIRR